MQKSLTYKSSLAKDSFSIFSGDMQIGKLYKKEWLGSPIETTINGQRFEFVSQGIFPPVITVFDKVARQKIGTVTVNSFFRILPSATLCLPEKKVYQWKTIELFSHDWQWCDLSTKKILVSSKEPLGIFRQNGRISLAEQGIEVELFIALGIHLRQVAQKQNLLTRLLSLIALALILPRVFALFSA